MFARASARRRSPVLHDRLRNAASTPAFAEVSIMSEFPSMIPQRGFAANEDRGSLPTTTPGRGRPSLARLKVELHQRLLVEGAEAVALDLLNQAKAGDLLAIRLLL